MWNGGSYYDVVAKAVLVAASIWDERLEKSDDKRMGKHFVSPSWFKM
jgi:hypothetical protein